MVIYLVMLVQRRIKDNKLIGNAVISGHLIKEEAENEIRRIISDLGRFGIANKVPENDFRAETERISYDYYVKNLQIKDNGI